MLESPLPTADELLPPSDREPAGDEPQKRFSGTPRLLCVSDEEPSWVALALGITSSGLAPPRLLWVSTGREAVSRVREQAFDAILIDVPATGKSARDDDGPFGLIRALRTGGCEEPIVAVGRLFADAEWMEACAADCDVFVSPRGWDSSALGAMVKRALVRGELVRENERLSAAHRRRLVRERDECEQLLAHQRQFIADLEAIPNPLAERPFAASDPLGAAPSSQSAGRADGRPSGSPAAADFEEPYRGLLRSYVLMGSGSLATEIAEMADRFVAARVPPPEALELHLMCVENLVKGLGNRSTRHIVARADLLAIEMMTHLAHRAHPLPDSRVSETAAPNQAFRFAAAAPAPAPAPAPVPAPVPSSLKNVSGISGIDLSQEP